MCDACLQAKRGNAASRSSVTGTSHKASFEIIPSVIADVLVSVYVSIAVIFSISYVFWFRQ